MAQMIVKNNETKWMMYFDRNTPALIQQQILLTLINKKEKYSLTDANGKTMSLPIHK